MMDSCRKVSFNVLCSFPSVVAERDYPMYLKDIFLGRMQEILSTCNIAILKKQFMICHLNETAFVSYSPLPLNATETCEPKISQRILLGLETPDMTPGCSVISISNMCIILVKDFFLSQ